MAESLEQALSNDPSFVRKRLTSLGRKTDLSPAIRNEINRILEGYQSGNIDNEYLIYYYHSLKTFNPEIKRQLKTLYKKLYNENIDP